MQWVLEYKEDGSNINNVDCKFFNDMQNVGNRINNKNVLNRNAVFT